MNINIVSLDYYTIYIQSSPSVFVVLFSWTISTTSLGSPTGTKVRDVLLSFKNKTKISVSNCYKFLK